MSFRALCEQFSNPSWFKWSLDDLAHPSGTLELRHFTLKFSWRTPESVVIQNGNKSCLIMIWNWMTSSAPSSERCSHTLGPHLALFNRPTIVSLRNSSVREFRPSPLFGWGNILGGPERHWVYLFRLRHLLLLFPHGVLTVFLFQGLPGLAGKQARRALLAHDR